jgi:hypothetical protein
VEKGEEGVEGIGYDVPEVTCASLTILTLTLLTWRIWLDPNNASRWQVGFNSAFKGLIRNIRYVNSSFLYLKKLHKPTPVPNLLFQAHVVTFRQPTE